MRRVFLLLALTAAAVAGLTALASAKPAKVTTTKIRVIEIQKSAHATHRTSSVAEFWFSPAIETMSSDTTG